MEQPGFDADERFRALSAAGALIEHLKAVVDFEVFRAELEAALQRADRSRGGRPAYGRDLFGPLVWNSHSFKEMALSERDDEHEGRAAAYYPWVGKGRPEGNALDHWLRAKSQSEHRDDGMLEEQEKVVSGQPADMQAIMTNDARGG